ncbi:hypothetical protein DdX_12832 [Ditylenchus destructor]|uniref:PH domain-containing protein n=1 Tax=Ditylenchus destructor TaxID=166010 RepID=A0AAD4R3D1_9BILA|nr:hypothetical protein DdX_12832 [Ditylenchus destructor]
MESSRDTSAVILFIKRQTAIIHLTLGRKYVTERIFLLFSADSDFESPQAGQVCAPNVICKNGRLLSYITATQAKFLVDQGIEKLNALQLTDPSDVCKHQPEYQFQEKMTFRDLIDCCTIFFPFRNQFEQVVDVLFERYVQQVVKKGFLMCRRMQRQNSCLCRKRTPLFSHWKSYWCVLLPGNICLWPLDKAEKSSKKHRKRLLVDRMAEIEIGSFERDRFVWQIKTPKWCYQFAHFDGLQRQLWISDLELVVNNSHRADLAEYDRQNSKFYPKNQRKNWQRARSSSSKILLESENLRLMDLLEVERKALYDEELVRQLATRMLDEEAERSDGFRRTIQFLSEELEYERSHRLFLEKRLYEAVEIAEKAAIDEPIYESTNPIERRPLDYLIISTQSV